MRLNPGSGRRRVVAIGLDSAGSNQLERYMASGVLPRIRRLRERGALAVLSNRAQYAGGSAPQALAEGCWVEFQTGARSSKTGYWGAVHYDPATYDAGSDPIHGGYDYRKFPPFYALGNDRRVATLDVPVAKLCEGVSGLQVLGWGGHFPFVIPGSQPRDLLEKISADYGPNPILYRDAGVFWNPRYLAWLERASIDSVRARARLCLDLLAREPWDMFLAVFGETHGAGHDLWFAGDPDHPVHAAWRGSHDPLASVFAAVDQAVGEIADRVPEDSHFVLFSVNGMAANVTDAATFFLLPELLYRLNFPGRIGFAAGNPAILAAPAILAGRHANWYGEIWRRRHVAGRVHRWLNAQLPAWLVVPPGEDLRYPYLMDRVGAECGWMPSKWYQPAWPRMRSFALPAFADGHVRINLRGREAAGIVRADDYDAECARVTEFLRRARHGRTGRPLIREVLRTRRSADDDDPRHPHADLVVVFEEDPVDVVDSPDVGRIGPIPFYRTGGHTAHGFAIATGPAIEAGRTLPDCEVIDLAPTLLEMLGAPVPGHCDGRSWLTAARISRRADAT